MPGAWGTSLVEQYPEVVGSVRSVWFGYPASVHNKASDKILLTEKILWVENSYPEILHFQTQSGIADQALQNPNAIVINSSTAKKLFGEEDPVGKSLIVKHPVAQGQDLNVIVGAVFDDYPDNVHLQPDYLINIEILRNVFGRLF